MKMERGDLSRRISLGSSTKPKLSGEEYYSLFTEAVQTGKPKEQFHEAMLKEFRTTPTQLRAFDARVTMGTYGPKPIYIEPEIVQEKPKHRTFGLKDVMNSDNPAKFYERMTKEAQLRVKYFLEEDLPYRINLAPEKIQALLDNIAGSKWYKTVLEDKIPDDGIIPFFDDIMLYTIWRESVPDKETIKNIYENSKKGLRNLPFKREQECHEQIENVFSGVTTMDDKPVLTREEAYKRLEEGWSYEQIEGAYRGVNRNKLRAYKAWITMRNDRLK